MRPFPLPWTINNTDTCYWIEDATGKRFAYTYFKTTGWGSSSQDTSLTREEAERIVRNIVKLPDLLRG